MTNEDAIKWLKVEQCCVSEEGNGKELIEAYDMAIKALEEVEMRRLFRETWMAERYKKRFGCAED